MRLVWGSARFGTVTLGVLTVVASLLPPAMAYVAKLIIDGVVAARTLADASDPEATRRVITFVAWEVGLAVLLTLVERSLNLVRQLVGARVGIDINLRILHKALSLELPQFENPEFYD